MMKWGASMDLQALILGVRGAGRRPSSCSASSLGRFSGDISKGPWPSELQEMGIVGDLCDFTCRLRTPCFRCFRARDVLRLLGG